MKSVFVCQLTQEEQKAIRTMLTDIILHGCGNDPAKVQEYYGVTLDEAVQTGMDSKVVDLDYLMTFYAEDFQTADGTPQLDNAKVISSILRESQNHETEYPFIYPTDENSSSLSEQEDEWER